MDALLISACLLGENCKYNGGNNGLPAETLDALRARFRLVPVCPEIYGGLPTPRIPSERVGERVVAADGADVTAAFEKGALATLKIAKVTSASKAILKQNSPSCGKGRIYDGTFTRTLTDANGVCAQLLMDNGIEVFDESRIGEFI